MAETPNNLHAEDLAPVVGKPATPARKTRGDVLFDRLIYAGLNGVGTFVLTVPMAYWARYGEGRKAFESGANWISKTFRMNGKDAAAVADTMGLGLGGTAMIAPVYVAEHYRKPIVEWLNQRFGSETDKQAVVENSVPQTFGSILKGRAVAFLAVYAGFKLAYSNSKVSQALTSFEENVGSKTASWFKQPTHDLATFEALKAEHAVLTPSLEASLLKQSETKAFSIGKLAALDVFATAAATSILYVTSRIFAKRQAQSKQQHAPVVLPVAKVEVAPAEAVQTAPETRIQGEKHLAGAVAAPVQDTALQR